MRQAGILTNERDAQRFAAWLVTQRIEAHAEQDGEAWAVWIRDEDHLPQARQALEHYRINPQDPRYQGAERTAEAVLREEEAKRRRAHENVVEMRGRWARSGGMGAAPARRCPFVITLIAVSVLVAIATNAGRNINQVYRALLFVDFVAVDTADMEMADNFTDIRRGEVWRLVTPTFLHFGVVHLVFNLYWLWRLGGQIEDRRGVVFMAVFFLVLAAAASVGQALEASIQGRWDHSGGLSGVVYGLFGYLLIKVRFDNRDRYYLDGVTAALMIGWFVACILRDFPPFDAVLAPLIPPIANTAHAVGFFLGMAIAYAPLLVRKPA